MSAIKIPVRADLLGILVKILSSSVADVSVNLVRRIMTANMTKRIYYIGNGHFQHVFRY